MQRFLIICGILAFGALYALTVSTDSNHPLANYFWFIASASGCLACVMFSVVLRYIWCIVRDQHNHVLGSQIARRLAVMFMLVAVLPALFLLSVSAQFISHSIDSWFGNDTKEALERSLQLSQSALEASARASSRSAEHIRVNIAAQLVQHQPLDDSLHTPSAQAFAHLAIWRSGSTQPIAERNPLQFKQPELSSDILEALQQNRVVRRIESINGTLYTHGWLLLPRNNNQQYALFFRQIVPQKIAQDAELIEAARAKYAELSFAQKGLQTFFLATLLIAALLAITLALAAALYFARRFVEPILALADGARSVAQNDFSYRIPTNNQDELGQLAGLFNHMTEQLTIAQLADAKHHAEQDAARHYLERVLASLSSGVMTLDHSGCLKTYNPSAEHILDISLAQHIGLRHHDWAQLSPQHHAAADVIATLIATEQHGQAIEIPYATQDKNRILLGKAIRLPTENGNGLVLVFDNITVQVRAQKEAAWGEVARRLAHEIRNPLTPIQLSAERLAWKLHDKLDSHDAQILTKSTQTIIKQVAALQEMVEAFRNYARAPGLKLTEINLCALIEEVLLLYESSSCTFSANLGNIPLWLKADATAMRQVLHNLLKNAAEAAQSDKQPHVNITLLPENQMLRLTICNNGKSFSNEMLQKAFEPYTTDKPTGTGLGLAVVKKIVEEHNGYISLCNLAQGGASITLHFPQINHDEK